MKTGMCAIVLLLMLCGPLGAQQADLDAERAAILALHERARQAHFDGDAEAFLAGTAEEWLRVSGGEVTKRQKAERLLPLQHYLDRMTFDVVKDATPTVVEVSPDGQMAWLIGVVDVRGHIRTDAGAVEPVAFRSAFLHVYRKGDTGWSRVAEADTQRPLLP